MGGNPAKVHKKAGGGPDHATEKDAVQGVLDREINGQQKKSGSSPEERRRFSCWQSREKEPRR